MPHLPAVASERQPAPGAAAWGAEQVGPQTERPRGSIGIAQLFLPGVFARVEAWRRLAEAAMRDIAAGRPAQPPATVTIPQAELQPWARGLIYGTRATQTTASSSRRRRQRRRQCARALARPRAAAQGGGAAQLARPRPARPEQPGRARVAQRVQRRHRARLPPQGHRRPLRCGGRGHREGHCRLLGADRLRHAALRAVPQPAAQRHPAAALMRARERRGRGLYDKPGVTTNSSHGEGELGGDGVAPLAVNEGVPQSERYVLLPTVRHSSAAARRSSARRARQTGPPGRALLLRPIVGLTLRPAAAARLVATRVPLAIASRGRRVGRRRARRVRRGLHAAALRGHHEPRHRQRTCGAGRLRRGPPVPTWGVQAWQRERAAIFANKMEEGHDTIQAKKRAIQDDTQIWGKTDPTFGGNLTPIR